jgi:NAD(P)-dependent dehydrogenase (short-subunit alcohol dehydrogenase family)
VYALDRLEEPSPDFHIIAAKAEKELNTSLTYQRIDVRDVVDLNKIVEEIGSKHGRMDGLIAAAGIQQETPALEYTAEDANRMFEVNITGVFMTAQAVAKQMIKYGNGGSIVLIASMSGSIANKVRRLIVSNEALQICTFRKLTPPGSDLPCVQRIQSRRRPARA